MYFQGIRPDSLGDRDIYRALLSDGEYQEPERLDEAVNSVRGEGDVLIAPDESWMIVSCVDRTDGLGAGDLYLSHRQKDGTWSKLRNMGPPVNTAANEYCPMLSPDGRYLFFTSTRTGNGDIYWVDAAIVEGLREGAYLGQKPPGLVPELFAPGLVATERSEGCSGWGTDPEWFLFQRWIDRKSALYLQSRVDGRWPAAEQLPWTETYQVGDFTVAPDGRTLAFVSNLPIDGLGSVGEGGNIWIAERTAAGWSKPRPAGPGVNTEFHDSYPSVAATGNLYFFSRRPGGFGESDLYVSRRRDGRYLPAENLGRIVNTGAHEWDPYVAPDESYLIFNSTKAGGLGGDDFYISWKTASETWGPPVHLGPEINSPGSDNRPYVTADGKYFFFTSDRRGNRDIYWIDARILEKFRPKGGGA
jgi:dipeptidyl aminopeptidase/acylaminoacyl peptidase